MSDNVCRVDNKYEKMNKTITPSLSFSIYSVSEKCFGGSAKKQKGTKRMCY